MLLLLMEKPIASSISMRNPSIVSGREVTSRKAVGNVGKQVMIEPLALKEYPKHMQTL